MRYALIAVLLFLSSLSPYLSAQMLPPGVNAALYTLNNNGVDSVVVYLPSINDQLPESEFDKLPFYIIWRVNGKDYCNKFVNSLQVGQPLELPRSEIPSLAFTHFDEIENEEVLEPYYRQIQGGDTVWIMFPPTSYLKDALMLRADGRQVVKFVETASLDAKEYFNENMLNIHFDINLKLYTAVLRRKIKEVMTILESNKAFLPK